MTNDTAKAPVKVAIVGFGYWGPNVARNVMLANGATVSTICDSRPERLQAAASLYPSVKLASDYTDVVNDPSIQLVVVATPVTTHFALAMAALQAGKHVLIEKPMTSSVAEATTLINEARSRNLQIFVDHTFVFTPAVQKIKQMLGDGGLGDLLYYDSSRINLGLFQHDVDVVWDLLPHDLSILDFLLDGELPKTVSCIGVRHFSNLADQAYVSLAYPNNFFAHIHVNWVAPVKVRQVLLCGSTKMIVYDENTVFEKVRVYDRGVTIKGPEDVYSRLVQYREGDMHAPRLDNYEPLRAEITNVINSLNGKEKARVDGSVGYRVVRVLEAASTSLASEGRPVAIEEVEA